MSSLKPDAAAKTNANLLAEFVVRKKILMLPWLGEKFELAEALKRPSVRKMLGELLPI